jgi:hypothetical protein
MRSKRAERSNRSPRISGNRHSRAICTVRVWVAPRHSLPRTPTSNRPGQTPTCNDRSKSRNPLGYFALRCLSPFEGVLDERMLRIRGYGRFFGQFRRVVCRRFICPIFDTRLGHLDWQVWIFARTHGPRGSSPNGAAGDHGRSRERLGAECHATDQLVITGFWGTGAAAAGNR